MSAGDATSTSEERFAAAVGRRPLWGALASRGQLRRWLIASPAAAVFGGLFIAPVEFFFVMSFWRKKGMRLPPLAAWSYLVLPQMLKPLARTLVHEPALRARGAVH